MYTKGCLVGEVDKVGAFTHNGAEEKTIDFIDRGGRMIILFMLEKRREKTIIALTSEY